ncbi:DUF2214 family protein [Ottowia sp.]|uniref:DUF2214 family protein n=1 Tax=Ottowia sp. TaxID=1898956 RepID=UPI003A875047
MQEALLAFVHFSAVLGWVVFASAQAALCRAEWVNAAVVRRLVRLDVILWVATAAVLLTGLARTQWGAKGAAWYWGNGLLHLKLALFTAAVVLMWGTTRRLRGWLRQLDQDSRTLPTAGNLRATRHRIMWATHLIALVPLAAVFLARGFGV